jgi:2-amino-4-hydroxy-6-hydroxymethyldihydropteridine diphosphokinase
LIIFDFMNKVYLGIGGNLGDKWQNIIDCKQFIAAQIGPILQASKVYQTKAWGNHDQADFYNQVLICNTTYDCTEVLHICQQIEAQLKRQRIQKWGERTMDIDILFFNDAIIHQENCTIPHPHLHQRKFVLVPLQEIDAQFVHPVFHKSIDTLLKECSDELDIALCKEEQS